MFSLGREAAAPSHFMGCNFLTKSHSQCMHRANPYTAAMTRRDVRRSTILDDGPLAHGASVEEKVAAGWIQGKSSLALGEVEST